jgi:hypothetical protein
MSRIKAEDSKRNDLKFHFISGELRDNRSVFSVCLFSALEHSERSDSKIILSSSLLPPFLFSFKETISIATDKHRHICQSADTGSESRSFLLIRFNALNFYEVRRKFEIHPIKKRRQQRRRLDFGPHLILKSRMGFARREQASGA